MSTATQSVASPPRRSCALDCHTERESWGRYPRVRHRRVQTVHWTDELPELLRREAAASALAFGLGRSYGDSCLNEGRTLIDCSRLDRILRFDAEQGVICCEAGASLAEILELAVPHGWFLPVTPGTKFVTLGGAIANDVHGKNHHRSGTFGCHVRQLALYRSDSGMIVCGPGEHEDLFRATVGGLGLTGIIAWAEIQLRPVAGALIDLETIAFRSLEEFVGLSDASDRSFEYTVAWIDCLSRRQTRGIFLRGNHSPVPQRVWRAKAGPGVPFTLPQWALNPLSVRLFNTAYYRLNSHKRPRTVSADTFFYPLDSIHRWNRIYGKRGFLQYQCVLPDTSLAAVQQLLARTSDSGMGSFLAVLKRFGAIRSPGMLSFPRPGFTVSLDFPMRGLTTLALMAALDQVVANSGGALYPAKDAHMSPEMFDLSFPAWRDFERYVDPALSSSFWRRVTGAQ